MGLSQNFIPAFMSVLVATSKAKIVIAKFTHIEE
jgi:hypothetical protein